MVGYSYGSVIASHIAGKFDEVRDGKHLYRIM
jgi:hypothetical protein